LIEVIRVGGGFRDTGECELAGFSGRYLIAFV